MSNLKKGLTSLGKGVGGALKNIGKKIGEILPGMIGAIASFVFKTAGEAGWFSCEKRLVIDSRCGNDYD